MLAVRNAIAELEAGAQELDLTNEVIGDAEAAALATVLATNRTLKKLSLSHNRLGPVGARSLAAALDNNATLTSLDLGGNNIGAEGAQSLAAALDNSATLTSMDLVSNNIGAEGAQSLAAALDNNATLTSLDLGGNNIGAEGAQSLAAALYNNATLTSLDLAENNIEDEGARSLATALDNNATLTSLDLAGNNIGADIQNLVGDLVGDRLRVNELVPKVALWVASAVARRVELWDDILVLPPALAARAAVLALGDELLDLQLPDRNNLWLSPGGRDFAAAYLLPRADAALRQELQRLADAAKRAREGQSSSSSGSRAL
jgi:Ran GTPase-activating protein (RanGAP) involved in mRNA processing and transport